MNFFPKNYYSALEVSRFSSPMEIRKAFKKISLKLHPDKNLGIKSTEEFETIKHIYDVNIFFLIVIYLLQFNSMILFKDTDG
jgi:preprotein translocase subunit Sec63